MSAWLMVFVLLCSTEACKWYAPGTLKGWEVTEVGDPRLCDQARMIMNSYPMPYTDFHGRKVSKLQARCVLTPEPVAPTSPVVQPNGD